MLQGLFAQAEVLAERPAQVADRAHQLGRWSWRRAGGWQRTCLAQANHPVAVLQLDEDSLAMGKRASGGPQRRSQGH